MNIFVVSFETKVILRGIKKNDHFALRFLAGNWRAAAQIWSHYACPKSDHFVGLKNLTLTKTYLDNPRIVSSDANLKEASI